MMFSGSITTFNRNSIDSGTSHHNIDTAAIRRRFLQIMSQLYEFKLSKSLLMLANHRINLILPTHRAIGKQFIQLKSETLNIC